jgi:hypothetical protein
MIRGTCERERRGVGVNMVIYAFMKIEQWKLLNFFPRKREEGEEIW